MTSRHFWYVIFVFVACVIFAGTALSNDQVVNVVLFTGKVFLVNQQERKFPVETGQEFTQEQYPWIELEEPSKVFLQRQQQLVQLQTSGKYSVNDLFHNRSTLLASTLSLLKKISSPRSYMSQARARGFLYSKEVDDPTFYENFWKEIIQQKSQQETSIPPQDLLSAAVYYEQQGNSARVAYILERLSRSFPKQRGVYLRLRNEALQNVSLEEINLEVSKTKQAIAISVPVFRNKALLIGVDRYDDPYWQSLNTPIRDVTALKDVLIQDYSFQSADILLLKNPTFDEIIGALNQMKREAQSDTTLLLYYAGHGYYPPDEEEGYWIPRDGGAPMTQRLFIPTSTILSKIKAIHNHHTLLIADSCFSGSLIRKTRSVELPSRFYMELSQKKSRQIITSGGLEPVSDQGAGNHSIFAGNLLRILSMPRQNPLSASELALNLRQEVKNAGGDQTPEYGRLHASDDHSGEYFFVRKHQQEKPFVLSLPQRQTSSIETAPKPLAKKIEAFQINEQKNWWSLGLFFHQNMVFYDQPEFTESSNGQSSTQFTAQLRGAGMLGELRKTRKQMGYGVRLGLGQLTSKTINCGNNDNNQAPSSQETSCKDAQGNDIKSQASFSGQFIELGGFADYSVFSRGKFSIQVGGQVQYQYMSFKEFLEEEDLESNTLGGCIISGFPYRLEDWTVRPFMDLCFTTFQIGGSLYDVDNEQGKDVRSFMSINVGVVSGFSY